MRAELKNLSDLHESAHFDRMSPLKEGMVITIEPGRYSPLIDAERKPHSYDQAFMSRPLPCSRNISRILVFALKTKSSSAKWIQLF